MKSLRYAIALLLLLTFVPTRGDDLPNQSSHAFAVEQKLKSIIVSIDFTNAKIDEAITALSAMSKQLDPDHKGINFVVQPEVAASAKPITLQLDNVPLGAALHYVCELARVRYHLNDRLITIAPLYGEEGMVSRTFHVDPSFVESATKAGVIPTPQAP